MKLIQFATEDDSTVRLGIAVGDSVIDIAAGAQQSGLRLPTTLSAVMSQGVAALEPLSERANAQYSLKAVRFSPCVSPPEKILCIGLNYRRHAQESGMAVPTSPVLFSKFNNSLCGHLEEVPLPSGATEYDYEVELAVVIGKEGRHIDLDRALDYVFGYCTANDLSARDLQMRTSQWILGKTLDKFLPLGPYLVTADEVSDPQNLTLSCWVNGERRQHSNTSDMVFSVAELISYISQYMTLRPGDVIATGTPEGVVLGMETKRWLKPGDEVSAEVEGLGRLSNRMVADA